MRAILFLRQQKKCMDTYRVRELFLRQLWGEAHSSARRGDGGCLHVGWKSGRAQDQNGEIEDLGCLLGIVGSLGRSQKHKKVYQWQVIMFILFVKRCTTWDSFYQPLFFTFYCTWLLVSGMLSSHPSCFQMSTNIKFQFFKISVDESCQIYSL